MLVWRTAHRVCITDRRAAFGCEPESKIEKYSLLMVKSESSIVSFLLKSRRGTIAPFFLFALLIAPVRSALAQDFTLQMAPFSPFAMNPGAQAQSNITLNPVNGFNSSVDLTCTVTTTQVNAVLPTCLVSPASVTPPGSATAVVSSLTSTGATATPGAYTITVTGTGSSITHTASQDVSVLSVTAQFTITVSNVVAPSSVPAGSGAQATISVNPISGYTGTVTLSCSSINPVVLVPPVCTFDYPSGPGLQITGVPATVNLTINTTGPTTPHSAVSVVRGWWALWLPLPVLGLIVLGSAATGKHRGMATSLLSLLVVAGSFLLLPACGNSSNTTTTSNNPNGNTPSNTYTFTLTGVDQNGNISSNTGTNNSAATVSLTVTTPAQ